MSLQDSLSISSGNVLDVFTLKNADKLTEKPGVLEGRYYLRLDQRSDGGYEVSVQHLNCFEKLVRFLLGRCSPYSNTLKSHFQKTLGEATVTLKRGEDSDPGIIKVFEKIFPKIEFSRGEIPNYEEVLVEQPPFVSPQSPQSIAYTFLRQGDVVSLVDHFKTDWTHVKTEYCDRYDFGDKFYPFIKTVLDRKPPIKEEIETIGHLIVQMAGIPGDQGRSNGLEELVDAVSDRMDESCRNTGIPGSTERIVWLRDSMNAEIDKVVDEETKTGYRELIRYTL